MFALSCFASGFGDRRGRCPVKLASLADGRFRRGRPAPVSVEPGMAAAVHGVEPVEARPWCSTWEGVLQRVDDRLGDDQTELLAEVPTSTLLPFDPADI